MTKHDDGGPAYPHFYQESEGGEGFVQPTEPGMSLWDAAALAALQGLCAYPEDVDQKILVRCVWDIADAFIAERRKRIEGAGDE